MTRQKTESRCRNCGCTDSHACPGGCAWATANRDLCTACVDAAPLVLVVYHESPRSIVVGQSGSFPVRNRLGGAPLLPYYVLPNSRAGARQACELVAGDLRRHPIGA